MSCTKKCPGKIAENVCDVLPQNVCDVLPGKVCGRKKCSKGALGFSLAFAAVISPLVVIYGIALTDALVRKYKYDR